MSQMTHPMKLPPSKSQKTLELFSSVMSRANDIYAGMKLGSNVEYTAPELIPHIQSDQVRAICLALCEILSEGQDK